MTRLSTLLFLAAGLVLLVAVASHAGPVPDATIDADSGSVSTTDAQIKVGEFSDGNTVTITARDALAPLAYSLRITSIEDVALVALASGRLAAIVPSREVVSDPSEWSIRDPTSSDLSPPDDPPGLPDDPNDPTDNPDSGPPDTTYYPDGDSIAPPRDGMGIVSDAIEEGTGGHVVAALDPPSATDALGRAVAVTLSVQNGLAVASIVPAADVAFPVSISLVVGYDLDYHPQAP